MLNAFSQKHYFKGDNKKIEIKWPNDLLLNKKKFCGILQEKIKSHNFEYLIVGIGLNTNIAPQNKSLSIDLFKKYNE